MKFDNHENGFASFLGWLKENSLIPEKKQWWAWKTMNCQYIAEYACRYVDKLAFWKSRTKILEKVKSLASIFPLS